MKICGSHAVHCAMGILMTMIMMMLMMTLVMTINLVSDLRVMIDFVPGHTSSDHPWFQQSANRTSPYEDYYIWTNGTTLANGTVVEPSNWVSSTS